jgi:hypothetical protein
VYGSVLIIFMAVCIIYRKASKAFRSDANASCKFSRKDESLLSFIAARSSRMINYDICDSFLILSSFRLIFYFNVTRL